jgi:hypothetical protein
MRTNKELALIRHLDRKIQPWLYILVDIKKRCNNPKRKGYENWGGRGIKNLFKNADEIKFLWFRDKAYEMKRPSIDRIDNDGHYCLENCRFIELKINAGKDKIKPILQYNKQGEFVREWESLTEANKTLHVAIGDIWRVLNGKRPFAGGYNWKYKLLKRSKPC